MLSLVGSWYNCSCSSCFFYSTGEFEGFEAAVIRAFISEVLSSAVQLPSVLLLKLHSFQIPGPEHFHQAHSGYEQPILMKTLW
jgi:hypothetical protein